MTVLRNSGADSHELTRLPRSRFCRAHWRSRDADDANSPSLPRNCAANPGFEICSPQPLSERDLLRVHTPEYVLAIKTGSPRELAESQKFPWSPALFSSTLLTNGGVLAGARTALDEGISGALASGFHHAFADHGEGFCTFNGLVVALEALRAEGRIQSAAILDLDLHYGNGTASLAASRPWIKALSIYGNDYANNVAYRDVNVRRHTDGKNHFSVPIMPSKNDGAASAEPSRRPSALAR